MKPIVTPEDARAARRDNPEQWYRADDNRLWKAHPATSGWDSIDRPGGEVFRGNDADAARAGLVALVPDATVVPRRAFIPREEFDAKPVTDPDMGRMMFVPSISTDTREVRVAAEDGDRRVEIVIENAQSVAELEQAVSLATAHTITLVAALERGRKDQP